MKFTTINSMMNVTDEECLKTLNDGHNVEDLSISAYIEEELGSRHITLYITPDYCKDNRDDCDVYLDLDIYQAELLGKKILELVEDRKNFLQSKFDEK